MTCRIVCLYVQAICQETKERRRSFAARQAKVQLTDFERPNADIRYPFGLYDSRVGVEACAARSSNRVCGHNCEKVGGSVNSAVTRKVKKVLRAARR